MKINIKSLLISLLLIINIVQTNAITVPELSKEQKAGAMLINTLYGPIKRKLIALNKKIEIIEERIANAVSLFAAQPKESKEILKKSLTKKFNKLASMNKKLASIQKAIQRCPLSLKTDRAQQAISKAGLTFLGDLSPSLLEKRIQEAQTTVENLLEILA